MSLEAAVDRPGDRTAVVTITGPLALGTNLKIVDTRLQQLVTEGVRRLVLDLSGCAYSDSAGLGVLVHTFGLMQEKGGAVRLCGVGPRILSLLQMTKADGFLPIDANRTASLAVVERMGD